MIEPTRVFALRHGQTAWNAELRLQGHRDAPLDGVGRWQAARLAQALVDEGLAAIYSSDLQRAHDTALALGAACGLPVQADVALRERSFGHLEGLTHAEIEERLPDDALRWRRREPAYSPGGGESLIDFAARCVPAVARLAAAHAGQAIAVVAHGGVLDCLYRSAAGLALDAPRAWALRNAAVNRLLFNGEGFVVLGWDDDRHLLAPAPPG
ncbi:MAG: histidine phosphatase family protein [Rubrivivax sp.]|nr:histidine phosphatase family protein [Rubrivivax sp.]